MTAAVAGTPLEQVVLPIELIAHEPPEARGLERDAVRLMMVHGDAIEHAVFHDLGRWLSAGDVLVVNTSATVAAAADARRDNGEHVVVHVAAQPRGRWLIEVRARDQHGPVRDVAAGERLWLDERTAMDLREPFDTHRRLWCAEVASPEPLQAWLQRNGRPITYAQDHQRWPLSAYQTVFARHPGSAEMPSAARPFSISLVTALVTRGVVVAPIVLHTGLSSLEIGESPPAEWYEVSPSTARVVNEARHAGGRVIAVGTTVVRALESAADEHGNVVASSGWTDLMLTATRPTRTIDALLTGWHEPRSTHLQLLQAVTTREVLNRAYECALNAGYLWHEFGDSCLLFAGPC